MKVKIAVSLVVMIVLATSLVFITREFSYEGKKGQEIIEQKKLSRVDEILSEMTLEEKVGQMFMGCFYSFTPSPEDVSKYNLGGILIFDDSFTATPPEELKQSLQNIDDSLKIEPFIAVDEEGGSVVRVSSSPYYRSEPFSSPRKLYEEGGIDALVADCHEKNKLLLDLGIDMNLSPVCDISTSPGDFMYYRSLGLDPENTGLCIEALVSACVEDGLACSLKHFPGYGNAADTHIGSATDESSIETIKENDLIPFKAGIDAGAHSVLISHNIVTAIDAENPASLSVDIHKMLRKDMGFDGVVITDDLSMGAIAYTGVPSDTAIAAINAGNDILCTGDFESQYPAVIDAVNSDVISVKRINNSVRRILKLKLELGMIE